MLKIWKLGYYISNYTPVPGAVVFDKSGPCFKKGNDGPDRMDYSLVFYSL